MHTFAWTRHDDLAGEPRGFRLVAGLELDAGSTHGGNVFDFAREDGEDPLQIAVRTESDVLEVRLEEALQVAARKRRARNALEVWGTAIENAEETGEDRAAVHQFQGRIHSQCEHFAGVRAAKAVEEGGSECVGREYKR